MVRGLNPCPVDFLPLLKVRRAPEPTIPPVQWVPGSLPHGGKAVGGVRLTTSLHLVPRLRMSTAIPPSPYMPSCRGEDNHNFTFNFSMPNVNTVLTEKLIIIHLSCIQQYIDMIYSNLLLWYTTT